ncbi:phosphatase PAP2 family protein [Fictibacillus phosphorivorans]|uniref:phosphatase PAP2 family protein n=1 Tax=Fictibacillus phosphorivorans TaxID=1221500 RepID=UPI001292F19B|nr:phosphatase PAP2 family protein [Fictibacillus phosphorivorans]MQR94317.1 phosphatase PAP2 family protein [Fictibacillus phosphorivorans]
MILEADYNWFMFINEIVTRYPFIDDFMIVFAEYVQYAFVLLIIMLWWRNRNNDRVTAFQVLFAFTLSYSLNRLIELFIYRERPFISHDIVQLVEHTANSSFPSDHASSAISIAVTLLLVTIRFRYIWCLAAILITFSRVWVGVHYPLDVIAGALNGILIALITHFLLIRMKPIAHLLRRPIFHS